MKAITNYWNIGLVHTAYNKGKCICALGIAKLQLSESKIVPCYNQHGTMEHSSKKKSKTAEQLKTESLLS